MSNYLLFMQKRQPQLADLAQTLAHSIPLIDDEYSESAYCRELIALAESCNAERGIHLAYSRAVTNLGKLENLEAEIRRLVEARKAKAQSEYEKKKAEIEANIAAAIESINKLNDKIDALDPKKDQAAIDKLKEQIGLKKSEVASLQSDLASLQPKLPRKTPQHILLCTLRDVTEAATFLCDVCSKAGKRKANHFIEKKITQLKALKRNHLRSAWRFLADLLISLRVLKKSTDSQLPDIRCYLKTIRVLASVIEEYDANPGAALSLNEACEIARRPITFPGWVAKLDPCCGCKEGPAGGDERLSDAGPLKKIEQLKEYRKGLQRAQRCREQNPAATSGSECDGPCECSCDETCMPQNPCCAKVDTYVTDLMTVRQTLECYEAAELAHIHNTMAGESLVSKHTVMKEIEAFEETEETVDRSEEQEYASTEQFELQSAVQETTEKDFAADAGITTSAKYGIPNGEMAVSASANVSYSNSKSKSRKESESFAKDVTERSVMRLQQKTRELSRTRRLTRTTDKNIHTIEGGADHTNAQFFWTKKVYRAETINWGKRMMVRKAIFHPSKPYKALLKKREEAQPLDKPVAPEKPEVTPAEITRDNYDDLCHTHNAVPISPPVEKKHGFAQFSKVEDQNKKAAPAIAAKASTAIGIPPGYHATSVKFGGATYWSKWQKNDTGDVYPDDAGAEPNMATFSAGGQNVVIYRNEAVPTLNVTIPLSDLRSDESAIEITMMSLGVNAYNINVAAEFVVDQETEDAWRHEIYDAIMAKYREELSEYEDALDEYEAAQDDGKLFEIKGENPALNRVREREELQKQMISILSCQHFDDFKSVLSKVEPCGYPQIDFQKSDQEEEIALFYQHAFEWSQMMYLFSPYYWADKCDWPTNMKFDTGDALHNKFLEAGMALVEVPVTPGYEALVAHLLATGEIWGGEGMPDLDDTQPHYIAMHEEFKRQNGTFQDDRPGLVDIDFEYNDASGSPLAVDPYTIVVHGTDYWWDWMGTPLPGEFGSEDNTAIGDDVDREIIIDRTSYRIVDIELYRGLDAGLTDPVIPTLAAQQNDPDFIRGMKWIITLDRPASLKQRHPTNPPPRKNWKYATGGIYVGAAFTVEVPEPNLIWLRPTEDAEHPYCLPCYPIEC
ncbi:hypothetical protein [Aurantiacibacter sp. D1-12]|uniref:hypothetical protein n=1 Tax=Aurantiacibacter sp. D1-12 TaxID=2993658 RepID=UPI00237CA55B|nr:hypothetical protein [Aurantiacibacter sp. D1-12]MDE1466482.1 hypothetical protein [Aurantiacibacter sp. D1-12]